jgi:hypothetical protein
MRKSLIMVLAVLLLAGAASAGSTVTLPVDTKNVAIGGSTNFNVVLNTSYQGPGTLNWVTGDPAITATLDGGALATSGHIDVNTEKNVEQVHTLTVAIGSGAVVGQEYIVDINYCHGNGKCEDSNIRARAEGTVIPTPELGTSILTATGLVGLLGLVRMRRKE